MCHATHRIVWANRKWAFRSRHLERSADPFTWASRGTYVVSPYAKAGYVSHQQHPHISLLKFVETIFDLKPLIECKEQVDDMLDCSDFIQKPLAPIALQERRCT